MTAGKLTEDEFDVKDFLSGLRVNVPPGHLQTVWARTKKKEAPDQGASVKLGFKQLT